MSPSPFSYSFFVSSLVLWFNLCFINLMSCSFSLSKPLMKCFLHLVPQSSLWVFFLLGEHLERGDLANNLFHIFLFLSGKETPLYL